MRPFAYRDRIKGGVIAVIGYILSPLSWWNDFLVNIPIAYGGAWLVSLLSEKLFIPAFIMIYWLTNIAGLMMMHKGIRRIAGKAEKEKYSARDLTRDIGVSLLYTFLILILVYAGLIRPPAECAGIGSSVQ
jgi:hypothetical protein